MIWDDRFEMEAISLEKIKLKLFSLTEGVIRVIWVQVSIKNHKYL